MNELKFMLQENEFGNLFSRGTKLPQIDALACNAQWINHCLDLGLDVVIRAKKNNNSSIKAIIRKVHTLDPVEIWDYEKGFVRVSVSESTFLMDNVNCPLRFVKYAMKHPDSRRSQILIVTGSLEMSLRLIFIMIKARWDIENSIFNNLKTECGLEHCYVHGGNADEAVLYLIFIANNIMQLSILRRLKRRSKRKEKLSDCF